MILVQPGQTMGAGPLAQRDFDAVEGSLDPCQHNIVAPDIKRISFFVRRASSCLESVKQITAFRNMATRMPPGSTDISKGNSSFIVYLDSVWFGYSRC
jgi:hypothetical protein